MNIFSSYKIKVKYKIFESKQFIFTSSLLFLILLNQNIIRTIKTSLVVTLISPEIISFIKLYGETPITAVFIIAYVKLYNPTNSSKIFRISLISFTIFFLLFGFLLFPNIEKLTLNNHTIHNVVFNYPFLKWIVIIIQNWILVLFYIAGELWTTIVYSLLFWEMINRITSIDRSKKDYPLLNLFGQFSTIIAGAIMLYLFSDISYGNLYGELTTQNIVQLLMSLICISSVLILIVHNNICNDFILKDVINYKKVASENNKTTILENLKFLLGSNYILAIGLNVICYSILIMIIEGLWFSNIREFYPNTEDFIKYQSSILIYIGLSTIFFSLISHYIVSKISWLSMALITPYIFSILGLVFIIMCYIQHKFKFVFLGSDPLILIVSLGAIINVVGKGAKYAFFDITKEMCYIPLNNELKAKGKAVIDVFCFKLGKILGALLPSIIFSIFPNLTYSDISAQLFIIFIIVCIIWVTAVKKLSRMYSLLIDKKH